MAIHLSGNDTVNSPSTSVVSGLTAFTTCMWVNFRSIGTSVSSQGDHALLLVGPDLVGSRNLMIWRDQSSNFTTSITESLSVLVKGTTAPASHPSEEYAVLTSSSGLLTSADIGVWRHLAVTWEASSGFKIYLDGVIDSRQGYDYGPISSTLITSDDYNLGYDGVAATRRNDCWMAEHAFWRGVALDDAEIAALAKGFSPLSLATRRPSLGVYQDLIRGPNHPGVGPSMSESGSPSVAEHPPVFYAPGAASLPGWRRLTAQVDSAWCAAAGMSAGDAVLPGAAAGQAYPFAEEVF